MFIILTEVRAAGGKVLPVPELMAFGYITCLLRIIISIMLWQIKTENSCVSCRGLKWVFILYFRLQTRLQEFDNPLSVRIRSLIKMIRAERRRHMKVDPLHMWIPLCFVLILCPAENDRGPAFVAEWLTHSAAMCSRAW